MNGYKYLVVTAVSMVAVLLGVIVVLEQFNQMVYPVHVTAFSLNAGEKGVCQVEFLGEKAQLAIPDLELMSKQKLLSCQILTDNAYQTIKNKVRIAVLQIRDNRLKVLSQEIKFERLLNTFERIEPFPLKEWLQRGSDGC